MALTLRIDTDNAVFHREDGTPNPGPEIARLLTELADAFLRGAAGPGGRDMGNFRDINGNPVGDWDLWHPLWEATAPKAKTP
jgi:hypothetical protein